MPIFKSTSKIIYFSHIPKTGGSSIENTLKSFDEIKMALHSPARKKITPMSPQHLHTQFLDRLFPENFFDWEFTVVRNPYARLVSEYNMKKKGLEKKGSPLSFEDYARRCFSKFKKLPSTRDNHIRPQVDFVSINTKVYNLENGLEAPLKDALTHLEISHSRLDPILRHDRKSKNPEVYSVSSQLISIIQSFYKDDFQRFGYDPIVIPPSIQVE